MYKNLNISTFFSCVLLIMSLLMGCKSIKEQPDELFKVFTDNEQYIVSGKFKIKYLNNSQSGYFTAQREKSIITLTVGKIYLLPEKKFSYYLDETIDLSNFLLLEDNSEAVQVFKAKELLDIIFNKKDEDWNLKGWNISYFGKNNNYLIREITIDNEIFELFLFIKTINGHPKT